jgi:nicotinate-nucleotide pyrophosphorylase (carboxylating)
MEFNFRKIEALVKKALEEDLGAGDITTDNLIEADALAQGEFISREEGVICGLPIIGPLFQLLDEDIKFKAAISDGDKVLPGVIIGEISGRARAILSGERVALNLLQRLSGVATLTRKFVRAVEEFPAKIYDTRKTTPLWRYLEKYAVKIGGGENHRLGLYDMVLIKDNHLRFLGRGELKEHIRDLRKNLGPQVKIEIEAENLSDVNEAISAGADMIMLDNMSLDEMRQAVELVGKAPLGEPPDKARKIAIEASGGVTLGNVKKIAQTGVDRISIGALTHSAPALDISLEIEPFDG